MARRLLSLFLSGLVALLVRAHTAQANDVIGCGGFVVSSVSINYAPIQVKLYTTRGALKYTSDCAPNNGYYFIPLYDTGDYVLRIEPPTGWSFEPMQVAVNYDGKTDICSRQTDVNFVFKGFAIFGKVFSSSSLSGPSDVQVTLLSKANNNVIKKNTTLENGLFAFYDILPGEYIVEATHENWAFEQSRINVDVVNDNVNLQNVEDANKQLRVLGYPVSGKVVSDGQPIIGVQFALFGRDVSAKKVACTEDNKPSFVARLSVSQSLYYLCSASSNSEGVFLFKTVPVGKYALFTFYETQNSRFEVLPFKHEFEVQHADLSIESLFQIGGFTISGGVSNKMSPNEPINGAQVTLLDQNGKNSPIQVEVKSNKGVFSIENVKTSNYLIKTSAPHYLFEDFAFSISPNTPNLPVISPSKFEVCGKVLLRSTNAKFGDIKLLILDKVQNSIVESVDIVEQDFCIFLAAGHYVLKLSSKYSELLFIPNAIDLKVKKPELDIGFEQFTASLSGHVELIKKVIVDDISNQLLVNLARANEPQKALSTSELKSLSGNRFKFNFANVLPGEYIIRLEGKLANLFCWENVSKTVKITDTSVDNVIFNQKGTFLQIALSTPTDLVITSPSGKRTEIEKSSIGPERTLRKCVEEVGAYQITPRGCHKFSDKEVDTFTFDTTSMADQVLTLTALQHLFTAHLRSASNLSDLSVKVTVRSLDKQHTKQIKLTEFIQLKSPTDQSPIYQYSLALYERPLADIRLEPISSQLLFKPAFFEFKLNDDCYQDVVTFNGRVGVFIDGLIKPKIENVNISVFDSETNELILTTKSNSEGKYSGGPFDDDIKLRIEAAKHGFVMKQVANKLGHFEAHELCSISTTIVDQDGQPLSDVLVSISGGENNFRKNSVVNADGTLHFENLHPGQYFIRFMRKEYEFEPASKMVAVSSSDKHVTRVVGKKVAFSCFGVVDSLNREPEPEVVVEAVGLRNVVENSSLECSQIQEQAVTEPDGSYRILGLLPECQYAIRLKADNKNNIVQSIPRLHLVRVQNSDIADLRFIVLFKAFQTDLSVRVKAQPEHLSSLTVQLFRQDDSTEVPIFKQSLSTSPFVFFPSIPLDNKQYSLRLDSDLSALLYQYSPLVHPFLANQSHLHLEMEFRPIARQTYTSTGAIEHEASRPFYSIPLLVLALVFFCNRQLWDYLKNLLQHREQFMSLFNKRNSQTSSPDNGAKKKSKVKKIN